MTETSPSKISQTDSASVAEVIFKAVEQVSQPITVKQLRSRLTGPFKLPEEKLSELLEEMSSKGRLYRYPAAGRGKQPRYLARSPEQFSRETILRFLAQRPHTKAELLKRLKSPLAGYDQQRQRQTLALLISEEKVHEAPPLIGGASKRYSAQPPDPREYVEDALKKIAKKLGVEHNQIVKAAHAVPLSDAGAADRRQNDLSEKLLARMVQVKLAAAQGGLVPLNELWRSLQNEGWDKNSFDRTVLELADNYRVALHKHSFPANLSEEERSQLVADALGNFYVGIALR